MTVASKRCPRCGEVKPLPEFARAPRSPMGVHAYCKPCGAVRERERMQARRGVILADELNRFWARVNKNGPLFDDKGPCWVWTGPPRKRDGYGAVHFSGRNVAPHLVTLMLAGFKAPKDRPFADHMCRNRLCCNPNHLRYVTPYINGVENNDSPHAINARKTHCKRGHPFDAENTQHVLRYGKPARQCIACAKLRPSYLKKLQAREGHSQGSGQ
jgi:hypothetical protein